MHRRPCHLMSLDTLCLHTEDPSETSTCKHSLHPTAVRGQATSALDAESEGMVQEAPQNLPRMHCIAESLSPLQILQTQALEQLMKQRQGRTFLAT